MMSGTRTRRKKSEQRPATPVIPGRKNLTAGRLNAPVDIDIDGSEGEGGGQVVRTAVALSALLSKSLVVRNIRASRSKPGLAAQHMAGVLAVSRISGQSTLGAVLGSTAIRLDGGADGDLPGEALPLRVEVQTAGACALVLQAALPIVLRCCPSGSALVLTGGTVGKAAPHADYVINVLAPNLRYFGVNLEYIVERDGFFPRGGAIVNVSISKSSDLSSNNDFSGGDTSADQSVALRAVDLTTRGMLTSINGRVIIAGRVSDAAGLAMVLAAKARIRSRLIDVERIADLSIVLDRIAPEKGSGDCSAITLWAGLSGGTTIGASALLERLTGKTTGDQASLQVANELGTQAADELCDTLEGGACVDAHMADQLAVFAGIANGQSRILISLPTLHMTTMVGVLNRFGVDCNLSKVDDTSSTWLFTCNGANVSLRS
jgi:RNA 3'-terminal phosphate cyclase (ATP)